MTTKAKSKQKSMKCPTLSPAPGTFAFASSIEEALLVQKVTPSADDFISLAERAGKVLEKEPTVLSLKSPIHLVGDIHGSWADLLHIFNTAGWPAQGHAYLFLGDYVDRGPDGIECLSLILSLKLRYPNQIHMIRGNHESIDINETYGFVSEVHAKYAKSKKLGKGNTAKVIETIKYLWASLPLCAVINKKIFCSHAGPPGRRTKTIEAVSSMRRELHNLPIYGDMSSILWSDPSETEFGWSASERRCGYMWGKDVTEKWHEANGFTMNIRAHQLVQDGYWWSHDGLVLTLFSASFYEGKDNKAAFLSIPNDKCFNKTTLEPHIYTFRVKVKDKKDAAYPDAVVELTKLFNPSDKRAVPSYFK